MKMQAQNLSEYILVLDEIQKIDNWSEIVKKEWDLDTWNNVNLKIFLCGSSRLLLQQRLTESLAGRFERINVFHWSFKEMQDAFGWNLQQYIYSVV
jgi:predicted AAA+ superfamily ATPase